MSGYPTFKYFKYFDKERKSYDGGRTADDFVSFMKDPENPLSGKPPPVPTPEEAWADHEGNFYSQVISQHLSREMSIQGEGALPLAQLSISFLISCFDKHEFI